MATEVEFYINSIAFAKNVVFLIERETKNFEMEKNYEIKDFFVFFLI